jgi:hypothetical protein
MFLYYDFMILQESLASSYAQLPTGICTFVFVLLVYYCSEF